MATWPMDKSYVRFFHLIWPFFSSSMLGLVISPNLARDLTCFWSCVGHAAPTCCIRLSGMTGDWVRQRRQKAFVVNPGGLISGCRDPRPVLATAQLRLRGIRPPPQPGPWPMAASSHTGGGDHRLLVLWGRWPNRPVSRFMSGCPTARRGPPRSPP